MDNYGQTQLTKSEFGPNKSSIMSKTPNQFDKDSLILERTVFYGSHNPKA